MGGFVHLHLHTQYSLLDGGIRVDRLFERAKELGFESLAITDHGNLFGAVRFYQEAKKAQIKPIIGCELYVAPRSRFEKKSQKGGSDASYHLTVLVKDHVGYKNLIKLASLGYLEGFYYKPRVDKELLREMSSGLIALSGCLKGEISQALLKDDLDKAVEIAREYLSIFGEGNFFIEIMRLGLEEEAKVNSGLMEVSRITGIPLVATNDCHYLYPEDAEAHEVLLCIQTGAKLSDTNRMRMSTNQLYLRSPEEMKTLFADLPEAVDITSEIAERCNFDFDFEARHLPVFNVPGGKDVDEYLEELVREGLKKRQESGELCDEVSFEEYEKRLKYELSVIKKLGFSSYFLIVWDFVNYAKSSGVPVGPGRGSAAGSLVSYCLGITDIDPLRWGLLFERFLNPDRISMPDIDIDFCMEKRDRVLEYVKNKYGERSVAKIITFGTLSARAVVRDVGRVLGFSPKEVDRIAKMIPQSPSMDIDRALSLEPRLKEEMEKNPRIKKLIEIARKLEGLCRHASTHAAGIVITPDELTEYIPLYKNEKENEITTQYAKDELEALGLLKMDLLGLKTLTVIDTTLKLIETYKNEKLDLRHLPLDDEKTYALLQSGATSGVFQLESSGMKELLRRLKPSRFEDLIALVALYRPGPLGSGMVDDFIERKHGRKPIEYELPELEPILSETYGVILYQEQVMKIAEKVAGFTLSEADTLRKAMGKKKKEIMERMREKFITGATERGVDRSLAEELFAKMEKFAEYGFNKSHSAAYAMIAYQTAYLKAHYPVEFMAALISSEINRTEKIYLYIQECREMGIDVLPPDINESHVNFRIDGNSLRFGLAAIKGVGEAAACAIIEARGDKPFESFYDFCKRVVGHRVNKKTVEALIKAGAFDSLEKNRKALLEGLDEAMEKAAKASKKRGNQPLLFDVMGVDVQKDHDFRLPEVEPPSHNELLSMEKEALGFYLSGHPLDTYLDRLKLFNVCSVSSLDSREEGEEVVVAGMVVSLKEITTRNGDRMAFVNLEDREGRIEVVVFPELYKETDILLAMGEPVIVRGSVSVDVGNDAKKILAQEIALLKDGISHIDYDCFVFIEDKADVSVVKQIKELALRYPGDMKLVFVVYNGVFEVLINSGVSVSHDFAREMRGRFDKVKVKLVGAKNGKAA